MILAASPQVVPFEAWRRAVQDQFQFGGTFISAVLVVVGLLGLIFFTAWLSNRQRNRIDHGTESRDPHGLFQSLLARLELLPTQRSLLLRVAKDLNLTQPTVVLLSESVFDARIAEWLDAHGPADSSSLKVDADLFVKARGKLFPNRSAGVIGMPANARTSHSRI